MAFVHSSCPRASGKVYALDNILASSRQLKVLPPLDLFLSANSLRTLARPHRHSSHPNHIHRPSRFLGAANTWCPNYGDEIEGACRHRPLSGGELPRSDSFFRSNSLRLIIAPDVIRLGPAFTITSRTGASYRFKTELVDRETRAYTGANGADIWLFPVETASSCHSFMAFAVSCVSIPFFLILFSTRAYTDRRVSFPGLSRKALREQRSGCWFSDLRTEWRKRLGKALSTTTDSMGLTTSLVLLKALVPSLPFMSFALVLIVSSFFFTTSQQSCLRKAARRLPT